MRGFKLHKYLGYIKTNREILILNHISFEGVINLNLGGTRKVSSMIAREPMYGYFAALINLNGEDFIEFRPVEGNKFVPKINEEFASYFYDRI